MKSRLLSFLMKSLNLLFIVVLSIGLTAFTTDNSNDLNNEVDNNDYSTLSNEQSDEVILHEYIKANLNKSPYSLIDSFAITFTVYSDQELLDIQYLTEGFDIISLKHDIDKNVIEVKFKYIQDSDRYAFRLILELKNQEVLVSNIYGYTTSYGVFICLESAINPDVLISEYLLHYSLISKNSFDLRVNEFDNLATENKLSKSEEALLIDWDQSNLTSGESIISGKWQWEASNGVKYPLKNTYVSLYVNSTKVAEDYTDENGNYSFTTTLTDTSNVRVQTRSKSVHNKVRRNILYDSYYANTPTVSLNVGENKYFSYYLQNSVVDYRAFQVSQALTTGADYVNEFNDGDAPYATCEFPADGNQYNSFWNIVYITDEAYEFWDIILHEYGHRIQHYFDLANSPGGEHSISADQIAIHGKDAGTRLAWGEGWPTFYAILVTQYYGTELGSIPNINDTFYNSYSYSTSGTYYTWSTSLETSWSLGEGCERSIFAALYDFYDNYSSSESYDNLSFGHQVMWDAVIESQPERFNEFFWTLFSVYYPYRDGKFGDILNKHGMAPTNFTVSSNVTEVNPPVFTWTAGGTPSHNFNRFQLAIYNDSYTYFVSSYLTSPNYTLTQSEWDTILDSNASPGSTLYAILYAWNTESPQTGFYTSSRISFIKPTHSFTHHYVKQSTTKHRAYCICGDYILENHNWIMIPYDDGINQGLQQYCPDCGALGLIMLMMRSDQLDYNFQISLD